MEMKANREEQLFFRVQSGDPAAAEEVLLRYSYLVHRIAARFRMQGFDEDDWTQEGYWDCWQQPIHSGPVKKHLLLPMRGAVFPTG